MNGRCLRGLESMIPFNGTVGLAIPEQHLKQLTGGTGMTNEEKLAFAWWEGLSDAEIKQRVLEAYRYNLKKREELKELGFKWGVGD